MEEEMVDTKLATLNTSEQVGFRLSHHFRALCVERHPLRGLCRSGINSSLAYHNSFFSIINDNSQRWTFYCRYCLATNHSTTTCPASSPQLRAKLINTHKAKLPKFLRRTKWIHLYEYRWRSRPDVETKPQRRYSRAQPPVIIEPHNRGVSWRDEV